MKFLYYDWLNYITLVNIILLIVVKKGEAKVTVLGQIGTDVRFYYQRLSEFPSKVATIAYTRVFPKCFH